MSINKDISPENYLLTDQSQLGKTKKNGQKHTCKNLRDPQSFSVELFILFLHVNASKLHFQNMFFNELNFQELGSTETQWARKSKKVLAKKTREIK